MGKGLVAFAEFTENLESGGVVRILDDTQRRPELGTFETLQPENVGFAFVTHRDLNSARFEDRAEMAESDRVGFAEEFFHRPRLVRIGPEPSKKPDSGQNRAVPPLDETPFAP